MEFSRFLCNLPEIQQALNPNLLSDTVIEKLVNKNEFELLELFVRDPRFVISKRTRLLNQICESENIVVLDLILRHEKTGIRKLIATLFDYACIWGAFRIFILSAAQYLIAFKWDLIGICQLLPKEAHCNAIKSGNRVILECILLVFKADHDIFEQALYKAISDGSVEPKTVQFLLENKHIELSSNDLLQVAVSADNLKITSLLLSYEYVLKGNLTFKENQLASMLITHNQCDLLKKIVSYDETILGHDYNRDFVKASALGYCDMVSLLLDRFNIDPCYDGNNALCLAFQRGHTAVVCLLMKNKKINPHQNPIPCKCVDMDEYVKTPSCNEKQ